MANAQPRRPRFRRATDNLQGIQITFRDVSILRHLATHRFLRSTHLSDLIGGSRQGVLRRLSPLFHHGYIERPRAQLNSSFRYAGSEPITYALASRGAALLRSQGMPFEEMAWTRKGGAAIGNLFLDHALLVSDCTVAAQLSCERHGTTLRWLSEFSHPSGMAPRSAGAWRVQLQPGGEVGVVPDAIFAIEVPGSAPCLIFLEADRGTMPVKRKGLEQTSFYRKLLAYRATWKAGTHKQQFGLDRFRVLTATSSVERRDHLIEACSELPGGHGLFLFADAAELVCHGDFLSFPWSSAKGGRQTLLP